MGRERGCTAVWPLCSSFSPRKLCVGKIRCHRQARCYNSLCGTRARSFRSTKRPFFSYALTNQQAVSITVEAVARFDGVLVGRQDMLPAGERADQREQRRAGQMKICEQTFHDTKSESGNYKKLCFPLACERKIRSTRFVVSPGCLSVRAR